MLCCGPSAWGNGQDPVPDLSALAVAAASGDHVPAPHGDLPQGKSPPERFAAGTWEVPVYGSVTFGKGPGELYLAHAGVRYYISRHFAASLEAVGGVADGDDTGNAIGCDLLLRWHLLYRGGWSLFVDFGAGILYTSKSFEAKSTHLNFTPQAGVGTTWRINETVDLMVGTRWHHISNANIEGSERNTGNDAPMAYGGVLITF